MAQTPMVPAVTPLPQVAWPDARPEWDDLTRPERDEERRDGTASPFFDDFILGYCPTCGDEDAIADEPGTHHFGCGERLRYASDRGDGTYWLECA